MTALTTDDELPSAELAPPRLLEGGASEHERRLIASARLDRVPKAARARVAAALGAVLEPLPATNAAPLEALARGEGPARIGVRWGVGIMGAGIVAAVALWLWLPATPGEPSAPTPRTASAPPPAPVDPGARRAVPDVPAELTEHPVLTLPPAAARPERSAPRRRTQRTAAAAPGDAVGPGLLAEVRALEAVSAALDQGHPDRAARELEAYRRRFARGELATEADVLAVQIAVARGDVPGANARAERLLARPGAEHYRARVRSLLDDAQPPPGPVNRERSEHGR
ncbi:MAG TPA: hypothetical protein VNN80_18920, partial [Polyangiaceae bacterium]|nr:hypothetical protein [Polyangiaceae bacterium]